jgi:hypothetical protein
MSKMDDLRAMREARYERAAARAPKPGASRTPIRRPAPEPAVARPVEPEPPDARLCGHRAISGKTCTRELGHSAKSHRYS